MQTQWIQLPSFRFDVGVPFAQENLKEITKAVLRILAFGVSRAFPTTGPDIHFVALCSCSYADGHASFAIYMPHQDVLTEMIDHTPPRMGMIAFQDAFERQRLDIQWRCGFPAGKLCPLAVIYKPTERTISFLNIDQTHRQRSF